MQLCPNGHEIPEVEVAFLGDPNYYNFVSDGFQAMRQRSGLIPCVLDAAIFSSYDGDAWNDENMVWWKDEGA